MITNLQLENWLNELLQPDLVKDYCPNGLQVEGRGEINKIITGVTASQALLDKAVAEDADAILVHHGYFWKGEQQPLRGMKRKRLKTLLNHDINLFAYHLPLDVHPEVGNNAQLGKLFGLTGLQPVALAKPLGVVMQGNTPAPVAISEFAKSIATSLGREPLVEARADALVQNVAWCTGGGQSFIEVAADVGADTFISGEVSEQTIHFARENDISFIAAGHHATERYGAKALGERIANELPVTAVFVDIDNPA